MLCGALQIPHLLLSHPTVALASHKAIILTFTLQPPSLQSRWVARTHGAANAGELLFGIQKAKSSATPTLVEQWHDGDDSRGNVFYGLASAVDAGKF